MKYNETLNEYGISKEDFENSKEEVISNGVKGKIISFDEKSKYYLMAFVDGGCLTTHETELHLFKENSN